MRDPMSHTLDDTTLERYLPLCEAMARKFRNIRDTDEARSTATMALFSAHRQYRKQQFSGSFAGYAYKAMYYALANLYRKNKVQMTVTVPIETEEPGQQDGLKTFFLEEGNYETLEWNDLFVSFLTVLNEEDRAIMQYRLAYPDSTIKEMAAVLSKQYALPCSQGGMSKRLKQLRDRYTAFKQESLI
ncbi:MAG: sigma-70 family RNA polymerase sigma factor [Ktedonobacteraceae bacterium]|nr:sigma-70 family RNA polymerase sigma factor [Ktedonobacteraceae bacterium]